MRSKLGRYSDCLASGDKEKAEMSIAGRGMSALVVFLALVAVSCSSESFNADVILATTTSINDSGLLDVLIPDFEGRTGYNVKPVAVGTGKALAMGERGEADVLLVHAPSSEKELLESGAAVSRTLVMHNYFAIVGPPPDPAGVRAQSSIGNCMRRIAESGALFISRGDDSGTHKMEKRLWAEADITPSGSWYQESGQGMGATLGIASEKSAYTLTDRATYLALKKNLDLESLMGQDPRLLNIYSVLEVNGDKFPNVNTEGGSAFAEYLVSAEAQAIIAEFGVDRFGEPLFIADAGKQETELGR